MISFSPILCVTDVFVYVQLYIQNIVHKWIVINKRSYKHDKHRKPEKRWLFPQLLKESYPANVHNSSSVSTGNSQFADLFWEVAKWLFWSSS